MASFASDPCHVVGKPAIGCADSSSANHAPRVLRWPRSAERQVVRPLWLLKFGVRLAVATALVTIGGCSVPPLTPAASLMETQVGEDEEFPRSSTEGGAVRAVSIVKLIVQPEKYDGRRVQVEGFVNLEFEHNVLCLNSSSSGSECIWVDVSGLADPGFRRGRAVIEGTFNGRLRGHFGCCAGTIENISRVSRM